MIRTFPTEREEKRKALLDAVEEVRDVLTAGADQAEEMNTLPRATVDALYESGLLFLKLPAVLGGAEADPLIQLDVLEAVCAIDASAGWCVMIGAASLGRMGAFLPDEAIEQMFAGGLPPKTCGTAAPSGQATAVDGGYLVNGRWSFASGIRHSQWVSAQTRISETGNGSNATKLLNVVFPTSEAEIHDNWHAAGLKGTGSNDFSVKDLFVPREFTLDRGAAEPKRGGAIYRLGMPGFVAVEHAAFAFGLGNTALNAIIELAQSKQRGYNHPVSLAARPTFQRAIGEGGLRLRAARALVVEILEEVWAAVSSGMAPDPRMQVEMRSSATLATDVAADVITQAFRFGGGAGLYLSSPLQRCLRDINAAAQHLMVSESIYETQGQLDLGFSDVDPLG